MRRARNLEDNLCKEAPVIALTANAINGAKEKYLNEGFTDYLSKPIEPLLLENTLIKYLPANLVQTAVTADISQLKHYYSEQNWDMLMDVCNQLKKYGKENGNKELGKLSATISIACQALVKNPDSTKGKNYIDSKINELYNISFKMSSLPLCTK